MTHSLAMLPPLAPGRGFLSGSALERAVSRRTGPSASVGGGQHRPSYLTPTLEQLYLVVISVAAGFAIALALAVLSHRRRWLVPPLTGFTGVLYDPEPRVHLPANPDHGFRHAHRGDSAHRVHAPDHLPQHRRRPRQRPGGVQGCRARNGNDRPPAPVAGGVTACGAGDRRRAAYRDRVGGDCDVRVLRGRRRARRTAVLGHRLQDQRDHLRRAGDPDGDRVRRAAGRGREVRLAVEKARPV